MRPVAGFTCCPHHSCSPGAVLVTMGITAPPYLSPTSRSFIVCEKLPAAPGATVSQENLSTGPMFQMEFKLLSAEIYADAALSGGQRAMRRGGQNVLRLQREHRSHHSGPWNRSRSLLYPVTHLRKAFRTGSRTKKAASGPHPPSRTQFRSLFTSISPPVHLQFTFFGTTFGLKNGIGKNWKIGLRL